MTDFLIPTPTEIAIGNYKGTHIARSKNAAYTPQEIYALAKEDFTSWWAIGMAFYLNNVLQVIVVSNNNKQACVQSNRSANPGNTIEFLYDGKTYYYSAIALEIADDYIDTSETIIPVYLAAELSITSYENAALELISLYSENGGILPGEVNYPTSWVQRLIEGAWQKTFAFAHAKTVYTDYANKKTLADKLSEIDTEIGNKANKTEIKTELPANGGNSATVNGHTVNADVPENAVFTDTVYDDTEIQKRISDNGYGEIAGGKNLFIYNDSVNFEKNSNEYQSFTFDSKTDNSVRCYVPNNGSYTGAKLNIYGLKPNTKYSASCSVTENTSEFNPRIYCTESDSNGTGYYVTFSNIQVEEGETATEYEPYFPSNKMLAEDVDSIKNDLSASNAGAHNSVYRGKYLGNALTTEQKAQISAGTFKDLYIGDYWTIDGVNYRIAAFDYWLNSGDTNCTTHHVVIVPDTRLYNAQMNTSNITTGAYVGSAMYTSNLEQAKTIINNAFGSENILSHREYLANATKSTTDPTYESAGSWYDSTVELMNERMVYGADVFHNIEVNGAIPTNYTIDNSQLPLFALEHSRICNRAYWWLRGVVSAVSFACVNSDGSANASNASYSLGIRPAFAIKG